PIGTTTAVIFKDTLMAAFLALGAPLVASERRRDQIWGAIALVAATAYRYNALAATLPIVVLLARFDLRGIRRHAAAFAAWIAITGAAFALDGALVDEHVHYWSRTQALQDIAGTLEYAPDQPDAELRELFGPTRLVSGDHIQDRFRAIYVPVDF